MKRCHLPRWLAVLALPLLAPSALATTVIAPDFGQLVGSADYVVRATVTSVTAQWRENPQHPGQKYIASLVALDVHEVLKGTPPSPLVLDLVGGRIGDTELVIEGAPQLLVGQESILFVRGNGRQVIPLAGLQQGHYPIRRDKRTGEAQVMRSNGQLLYSERELSFLQTAPSGDNPRNAQTKPLTPAQFGDLIRTTTEKHRRADLK